MDMYLYDEIYSLSNYVDLDDNPVRRTKDEYPYGYDSYVVWQKDYIKGRGNTVYSDRLLQWNYGKFNECCMKVWKNEGQTFYAGDRTPDEIELFLTEYFRREVRLTAIMQGCNASSGYPIWIFYYDLV